MWLVVRARPDIANAGRAVARQSLNPTATLENRDSDPVLCWEQ